MYKRIKENKKRLLTVAVSCMMFGMPQVFAAAENAENIPTQEPEAVMSETDGQNLGETIVTANRVGRETQYGFQAGEMKAGLLAAKPLKEIPFDVVSLNQEALKTFDSATESLASVLTLDPSVTSNTNGTAGSNQLAIRGISSHGRSMYLNGIPGMFGQYKATNFLEGIDIISGPGTGFNGTGYYTSAGGTINARTKRADNKPIHNVTLLFSGRGSLQESIDIGQRFGKNNRYGLRINALHAQGETTLPEDKLTQNVVTLNFDQRTKNSDTNLFLGYLGNNFENRQKSLSFATGMTTLPSTPDAGKSTFAPSWSYADQLNYIATLNHTQKISEQVSAFLNAGYHKEDWPSYVESDPRVIDNAGNFTASYSSYPMRVITKYLQLGISGDFKMGDVKNSYVLSVDRNWIDWWDNEKVTVPSAFTGNIYERPAWARPDIPDVGLLNKNWTSRMTGWSVLDTIKSPDEKIQLTLGIHGHKVETTNYNKTTGKQTNEFSSSATCPTVGFLWKMTPALNFFANHSEAFGMGTRISNSYENKGEILPPAKTKQNEFGLKYENAGFYHTLSYFTVEQQNTKDEYVGSLRYLRLAGRQHFAGIEYKMSGKIADKLDLIGGVMWLTRAEQDSGLRVNGAATYRASLGLSYQPQKDWSVIFRTVWVGASTVNDEKLRVPSYMKYDLGVTYKTKIDTVPTTFSLMCYNLFNNNYWQVNSGTNKLNLGLPRTIMLSASFDV